MTLPYLLSKLNNTSKALYLLPFFLLFLGGIIMYIIARNDLGNTGRNGLIFGFVWTPIAIIIPMLMIGGAILDMDPTTIEFYENMNCNDLAVEVKWQKDAVTTYALAGDREAIKFYHELKNYYNSKC